MDGPGAGREVYALHRLIGYAVMIHIHHAVTRPRGRSTPPYRLPSRRAPRHGGRRRFTFAIVPRDESVSRPRG